MYIRYLANSDRRLLSQVYIEALMLRHNNIMEYLNNYIQAHESLESTDVLLLMAENFRNKKQKILNLAIIGLIK